MIITEEMIAESDNRKIITEKMIIDQFYQKNFNRKKWKEESDNRKNYNRKIKTDK